MKKVNELDKNKKGIEKGKNKKREKKKKKTYPGGNELQRAADSSAPKKPIGQSIQDSEPSICKCDNGWYWPAWHGPHL